MINPIHLLEGHINLLLKKGNLLPEDIIRLGELRMELCKACDTLPRDIKGATHDKAVEMHNNALVGKPNYGPGLLNGKYCNKSKGGCGCDMEAKSLVIGTHCPIGRW